jgi:hypothetical protein
MVKLAGGVAKSMELGEIEPTPIPLPLTVAEAPVPPVKLTFPTKLPVAVGVKRTVTV